MAKAKKKSAKQKPAAKKPPAKKPPAKKPPAKKPAKKPAAKKPAKKPAAKEPAAKKPAAKETAAKIDPTIEADVAAMLASSEAGDIDNVFDIVEELQSYSERLPKTSKLYPEWKKFYDSCIDIMIEVSAK